MEAHKLTRYYLNTPVGTLSIVGSDEALAGIYFPEHKGAPKSLTDLPTPSFQEPYATQTENYLSAYFTGRPLPPLPRFNLVGTEFQLAVWQLLQCIPLGRTISYTALALLVAERLGKPTPAVRAVATAVGRNPISILIPCHRVIGRDAQLRGYAGGLERKRWLLEHELRF